MNQRHLHLFLLLVDHFIFEDALSAGKYYLYQTADWSDDPVRVDINPEEFMMHGLFSEFLFEHLDVLERVLTEKLNAMAPGEAAPSDEQSDESQV